MYESSSKPSKTHNGIYFF